MKSKTYVVSWDEVTSNTEDTARQLEVGSLNYVVIDVSTQDKSRLNWVRTNTVRYYNHFIWALSDFINSDYDIFVFNAGDILYPEVANYTRKIESIFAEDPSTWLIAPNCTNDFFTNDAVKIRDSVRHPGLYLSTHTNGIWVFFSREAATALYKFFIWVDEKQALNFKTMVSGWGLDTVYCAMALYSNKKIYRDASINVSHPAGSSYDHSKANQEYYDLVDTYLKYVAATGGNREVAKGICQMILDKVRQKQNLKLTLPMVYPNLENLLGEI